MSINEKEIKKLWGLSAGRCSYPGCNEPCIRFFTGGSTIIGEMAHVIAQSPDGPRGAPEGGADAYENLILLCPTHHTEIDKAPAGTFPPETLLNWKRQHEAQIRNAISAPAFTNLREMACQLKKLLIENHAAWSSYGPDSQAAKDNPLGNVYQIWVLRKLDTIVPNNRRINEIIRRNSSLFDADQYAKACLFIEHAEAFERNCYERIENAPQFPRQFDEVINACCSVQ